MSDSSFDRHRFSARLSTHVIGRHLIARAQTDSTNDDAWDALAQGAPDGTVVVTDVQTHGRGRLGRAWHTAPGQGLAMSVLLHAGCEPEPLATLPLAAGAALAIGLEQLGIVTELKWPNDVLLDGLKLGGILCEVRHAADGIEAAVVGVGVNISESARDFPPELFTIATSLAVAGHRVAREDVAAEMLNALEPLWAELTEGDPARVLEAWSRRARFWGKPIMIHTPQGPVRGVAKALDPSGALLLEAPGGAVTRVLAGDVEVGTGAGKP